MHLSMSLHLSLIVHCKSLWLDAFSPGAWRSYAPVQRLMKRSCPGHNSNLQWNARQALVQNLQISMQVLVYKTTISYRHASAWDCTACGSKYRVKGGGVEKARESDWESVLLTPAQQCSVSPIHLLSSCSLRKGTGMCSLNIQTHHVVVAHKQSASSIKKFKFVVKSIILLIFTWVHLVV